MESSSSPSFLWTAIAIIIFGLIGHYLGFVVWLVCFVVALLVARQHSVNSR